MKKSLDDLSYYIILRNNELEELNKKREASKIDEKKLQENAESTAKNIKNQTKELENNKNAFKNINNGLTKQNNQIENNKNTFENINNGLTKQNNAVENNKNTFENINSGLKKQTNAAKQNKSTIENLKIDLTTITNKWEKLKNIDTEEIKSTLNSLEEKEPKLNLLLEKMNLIENREKFLKWLEELVKKDPEIITKILQYRQSLDIILIEENLNKKINKLENENFVNTIILVAATTYIASYYCYKFINHFFKKNSSKQDNC